MNHPDDRRRSVAVFNNRPTLVETSHLTGKPRDKIPGDGYASRLRSGFASFSSSSSSSFLLQLAHSLFSCVVCFGVLRWGFAWCIASQIGEFFRFSSHGEKENLVTFFFFGGYFA
jgi:hypothetical protein